MEVCQIPDCTRPRRYRHHCGVHYEALRLAAAPPCSAEGCDRPAAARGVCKRHHGALRRAGDVRPMSEYRGDRHPGWKGGTVSYSAAHSRVDAALGAPADHLCVDGCGRRADDWSYDQCDPAELRDRRHGAYSPDPAHYAPRCRPCHLSFDRFWRSLLKTLRSDGPVVRAG